MFMFYVTKEEAEAKVLGLLELLIKITLQNVFIIGKCTYAMLAIF